MTTRVSITNEGPSDINIEVVSVSPLHWSLDKVVSITTIPVGATVSDMYVYHSQEVRIKERE